jgi:hypothetical protein
VYQLCLGDESTSSVVDRITERACAVMPELDREACRRLVSLIFCVRVRRTEACGSHLACRPEQALWRGGGAPRAVTGEWVDRDPLALPAMFAASAVDLASRPVAPRERATLELKLAAAFRAVMRPLIFCNPRCGRAEECAAEPIFERLAQIVGDPDADPA